MSQVPAEYVKRGMWVNLEEGAIMGRVITTDTRSSNIIVAILAVAVAFGTTHLWNIVLFAYHQHRVNAANTDGLYRQQQVLLRTLPAPTSLISEWAKLWWVWRKRVTRASVRSFPHVVISAVFLAGTLAVGIFTSYVVSSSDIDVLVSSPLCRPLKMGTFLVDGQPATVGGSAWALEVSKQGRLYAEDCYKTFNSSMVPERCKAFTKPSILLKEERVDCPFNTSICAKFERPALVLDSGLVDLNDGFGMNLPAGERVKYRKKTTCAILDLTGRWTILKPGDDPRLDDGHNEDWLHIYLGDIQGTMPNATFLDSLLYANMTLRYETRYVRNVQGHLQMLIGIRSCWSYSSPTRREYSSLLRPIPELTTHDADLFLVKVAQNRMRYLEPVEDPMFLAHRPMIPLQNVPRNLTLYERDFPASITGCQAQHQFCFARPSQPDFCTNLTGLPATIPELNYPDATELQVATAGMLISTGRIFDLETAARYLKVQALAENREYLPYLPNDQWLNEIRSWESTLWASLQIAATDYSIGAAARVPDSGPYVRDNMTVAENRLCTMQKMKNPGGFVPNQPPSNINVFALAFVLTLCLLITLIDILLLKFLIYADAPRKILEPRITAWVQDGVFQLQRRAYEARSEGPWDRVQKEVPVTVDAMMLSTLPVQTEGPETGEVEDAKGGSGDDLSERNTADAPTRG
ncbi:hypothetical protein M011DRAFT_450657 [Sporormia fimetaria CBS 119925]|uniref:Uncharacterized protein n=1 Tax=Sporormia fimetaria CBS 119925 TaxID=1340428 RepID=A0A6A6V1S8_9PLEO|nr:hypothetical protein M011DRAFT_450657 [Sporormia fimetaria CBS 119925]